MSPYYPLLSQGFMKRFFKILKWTLFSFLGLLIAVSILIYTQQDRIVQAVVKAINEQLQAPVKVSKVDLSFFKSFPELSVRFHDVEITETLSKSTLPMAHLKAIYCSFDPIDIWQGHFQFDKVILSDGEVALRITKTGQRNFDLFKNKGTGKGQPVSFSLKHIKLEHVKVHYIDEGLGQAYALQAENTSARLNVVQNRYKIRLEGKIISQSIKIDELTFFRQKPLTLDTRFVYNDNTRQITFDQTKVKIHNASFVIAGDWDLDRSFMNLKVGTESHDIQALIAILPEQYQQRITQYAPKGSVSINGRLQGYLTASESPEISLSFSCSNGSFQHPDYPGKLTAVAFQGEFNNGHAHSVATSQLRLHDFSGMLNEDALKGDFTIDNLNNPHVAFSIDGKAHLKNLLSFIKLPQLSEASGQISFQLHLEGDTKAFSSTNTLHQVHSSGEVNARDIFLRVKGLSKPLEKCSGNFVFNNQDVAVNDFSGNWGTSDFKLNGVFNNLLPYLLSEKQPLNIQAALQSHLIDLNEILAYKSDQGAPSEPHDQYVVHFPERISFDFQCAVDHIAFRRFDGRALKGQLSYDKKELLAKEVALRVGGGKFHLNGLANAEDPNNIKVHTHSTYDGISIDSVFYTFENFNQDFLVDKNLKGQIDADVRSYMEFDSLLHFNTKAFKASINATVQHGELNNFAPMEKLSKYVEEESLAHLQFSELQNNINIENETIYLPEMQIKSNVSTILISGTHTFDQHIDYHLMVPVKDFKKKDHDEAFGAIEDDGTQSNLFLTISGTTEDYKVSWDAKKTLRQVAINLKEEGKELKKAIKNKGLPKKKKEVQLSDDYFDW